MEIIERKYKIPKVDHLILLGINDQNISFIESQFNSLISVRGETIFFKGTKDELDRLERIFNQLVFMINKNKALSQNDLSLTVDLVKKEKFINLEDSDINSTFLFSKNEVIKAKTSGQLEFLKKARDNDIIFVIGPAGTGKTYLSVALAIANLKEHLFSKIILTRPAVEAGESLGFLPGDIKEKIDPYLRPLYDALEDMLPSDKLKTYLEKNTIEIIPLAYMRGRTLNNAFVILDEAQNATSTQMKMFLTRLGANSKAIITGDITQIDLLPKVQSGLIQAADLLKGIDGVAFVYHQKNDIVRHKLVKKILEAYDSLYNGKNLNYE